MTVAQAKQKAAALVAQMTVEEKASQLLFNAPAIERLGIHEHNWWNEACHGVALLPGATATIELNIDKYWVKAVDAQGNRITPDGEICLYAGAHQPDAHSCALSGDECLEIKVK